MGRDKKMKAETMGQRKALVTREECGDRKGIFLKTEDSRVCLQGEGRD